MATIKNWERLKVDLTTRLVARANKKLSKKNITPLEYISNDSNITQITKLINYILKNDLNIFDALYSISIKLLKEANIFHLKHVKQIFKEHKGNILNEFLSFNYPKGERDLLGFIYQSILSEGKKNKIGSYYTPENIVKNMISNTSFEKNKTFLDPCCGSGSFLLSLDSHPNQIYGIDKDPIAVFICKVNLLLKYKTFKFSPQIYCFDFIYENNSSSNPIKNFKFDYIITNPPWGVNFKNVFSEKILSGESFSYFFERSFYLLKENVGKIRFLFPKSILNIKTHKDIRLFMLNHGSIESISIYDRAFSGVTTEFVDIEVSNAKKNNLIVINNNNKIFYINKDSFYISDKLIFNFYSNVDLEIIQQMKKFGKYSLANSDWALGIVTGNNKNKIFNSPTNFSEEIYTGKDVFPYKLQKATKYIEYFKNEFQQIAREEYYRASEKLIYKFISNKLVFAYDDNKSLFLNSANILIPKIPNMSIKTVLAFLNSELFQYFYFLVFNDIKILKSNLIELPFPKITAKKDELITFYVDKILNGKIDYHIKIQHEIYKIFKINDKQKKYIKEKNNGEINY